MGIVGSGVAKAAKVAAREQKKDDVRIKKCHHLEQSNDLTLHTHSIHIEECRYSEVANQTHG